MSEFLTPTDIGNRACQHCGVPRMGAQGFAETSKAASAIGFAYGKLRRAELQRNFWIFAIKTAVLRPVDDDTMLLSASLYSASTTYFIGSIVADASGTYWISNTPNNLNFEPASSESWDPYFGPLTADLYDSGTTYQSGEIVYTTPGDGTTRVYLSLQNDNNENPATAAAYSATVTYRKNQVVTYLSVAYMSLINFNLAYTPSSAPVLWSVLTSYSIGNSVGGSDGAIYTSLTNANVGIDPISDDGTHWTNTGVLNPWTRVFVGGAGSIKWLQIGGSAFPAGVNIVPLVLVYPLGAGPSSNSSTRNIFKLPAGFLRKAPQDPKAGSVSVLGAPTNREYDDWLIESGYLISTTFSTITLRFVADVTTVRLMHDMFCEGLGARIGLEVCETLAPKAGLKTEIAQKYQKFMSEARAVDAIEQGATEAPLDDYLACRA